MIVPMKKAYVVARQRDRDALLDALGELGVVHVQPIDPDQAVAEEKQLQAIEAARRALGILGSVEPEGDRPDLPAEQAVEEVLRIDRQSIERRSRLATLQKSIDELDVWGDVRLEQFRELRDAGVNVRFFALDPAQRGQIDADCVELVAERYFDLGALVAAVRTGEEPEAPEDATRVELPQRDRPALRAEAAEIDAALAEDIRTLHRLAHLREEIEARLERLNAEASYTVASRSGTVSGDLYALQGWVPANQAADLAGGLGARGIDAAVESFDPPDDETPPTQVEYPAFARPMKGLFDLMGTVAGYREFDVSLPFMIALPIFAGMLIGDGAYGLILLLGPLAMYNKATQAAGKPFIHLMMAIGAVTFVWGLLTASFFGANPYPPLIPVDLTEESRNLVMTIAFYMGAIHLSIAQAWRGISYWPSLKAWSAFGWGLFIWGMLGVVMMFVLAQPLTFATPWPYLLIIGGALAILFESPDRNPVKMVGLGLANFPLSMLSAFSDVMSYVRLMAVGLASGILAASFNELAFSTGSLATAIPVLVLGHALNFGLALIALFAHGVRLNMLEFSNNLGMEWSGYPYQPFSTCDRQESET